MAWQKNGTPDVLGSAGDVMTISDMTALKFNQFLIHEIASSNLDSQDITFNNNTNTVYAKRDSVNGAADGTLTSAAAIRITHGNAGWDYLKVGYCVSISGEEKLCIFHTISNNTSGAGNAPNRSEVYAKFVPNPDADITRIDDKNNGSGSFDTNSLLLALGD